MASVALIANSLSAQCGSGLYYAPKVKLTQDSFNIQVLDGDSCYVFKDQLFGNVWAESAPDSSLFDGRWLLFKIHNSDSVLLEVNYQNGVKHGTLICRNTLTTEIEHYFEGKLDGQQLEYDENGRLSRERNYVKGIKHGVFCNWNFKGQISHLAYFNMGTPIGAELNFYDGQLVSERYYNNGRLSRYVFDYHTVIKKEVRQKRKKKKRISPLIYHSIKAEEIHTDTAIILREYFESGQLESEKRFIFIEERDCTRIYHKTGRHRFWSEEGELLKVEHYQNDVLIKSFNLEE